MCQGYTFMQATRARAPQNLRPRAGDCIRPAKEKKLCKHVVENKLILMKEIQHGRNQFFVKFLV